MQTTTRLAREVEQEARTHFGARVFQTTIRQNVRLAEASSHGRTVFQYDATSQGAKDYEALAREVLAIWAPPAGAPPRDAKASAAAANVSAASAKVPAATAKVPAATAAVGGGPAVAPPAAPAPPRPGRN
jgi:chromosome partitioning protein